MAVQKFLSLRHFTSVFALAIFSGVSVATSYADIVFQQVAGSRERFPTRGKNLRMGSFGAPGINGRNTVIFYSTCYGAKINAANNAFLGRIPRTGKNGRVIIQKGDDAPPSGGNYVPTGELTTLCKNPYVSNNYVVSWSGVFTTVTLDGQNQNITTNTYLYRTTQRGNSALYFYFPDQNIPDEYMDQNNRGAISLLAGDLERPDAPQSVFRASAANAMALVAVGETAIGFPLGAAYTAFGNPTLADNSTVFFTAKVSDTDSKFDGIWYGKNGDPNPLVLNGETTPAGGAFSAFGDLTIPSPSGNLVAFIATGGRGGTGAYVKNIATKEIKLYAYTGQPVTDYSKTLSGFQSAGVNNAGDVAFGIKNEGAALASADPDRVNAVIFVKRDTSEPIKVIATGDDVVVKGKEKRVIDIRFSSLRGLNDLGYVAFTASFNDRTSGVFLAKP